MNPQSAPEIDVTLDGYAALHRAVREVKADGELHPGTKLRSSEYLNNLIEQDDPWLAAGNHRSVSARAKSFNRAAQPITPLPYAA